jgi:arylsulfatase A-like enzyme
MFEEDRSDKPPEVQQPPVRPGWVERIRRRQLKTLMSIDDLMDRLFDELEGAGASENTLVIFTSDNGFLWGEHGRTGKRYPYQDSVQVPLLAWWPGHIAGGSDERLVANIDIAPTVLDAAGIEPEHVVDGRSLLDPSLERDRLLLEYFRREGRETPHWASLMTDAYQYVEYYADDRLVPNFREYYDLASDPWQLENLLGNDSVADDPISVGPALQLLQDVNCAGTSGQRACP